MALGLVPLAWLAALHAGGWRRSSLWWWVAAAYGVSFVADAVALSGWRDPWWVSASYPVSQAGIVGLVLLGPQDAIRFLVALIAAAIVGSLLSPSAGTLPLRTLAWGAITLLAWPRRDVGALRAALLVSFGVGLGAWWCFVLWPSLGTWALHQGTRILGTGLLCWAAWGGVGHGQSPN